MQFRISNPLARFFQVPWLSLWFGIQASKRFLKWPIHIFSDFMILNSLMKIIIFQFCRLWVKTLKLMSDMASKPIEICIICTEKERFWGGRNLCLIVAPLSKAINCNRGRMYEREGSAQHEREGSAQHESWAVGWIDQNCRKNEFRE